jgi:hypothetical protein
MNRTPDDDTLYSMHGHQLNRHERTDPGTLREESSLPLLRVMPATGLIAELQVYK